MKIWPKTGALACVSHAYVIPLILIQSKVQAKNIIYVDEDYPQEIFNGPAINSDESLQQLNDKIYFNMYYPPIIRNSYNEKTNEQSHQENEQNPITEDQRRRFSIVSSLFWGYFIIRDVYNYIVKK